MKIRVKLQIRVVESDLIPSYIVPNKCTHPIGK